MRRTATIAVGLVLIAMTTIALAAADSGGDMKDKSKKADKVAVSIHDMAFDPASLDINVGDSIEWTNNDVHDHTVAAKDNSFSSGNLGNGATYKYTFKKVGKFQYGCSLHPRMKGTINVAAAK